MAEELGFTIELRGDVHVLSWADESCRPATDPEIAMWWALKTRAELPSQGGEAVEVVAYRVSLPSEPELGHWFDEHAEEEPQMCQHEPLMTVAQHQRILAATTRPAGQVSENVNALSATALRRATRFLESIDNGCNEVKTLRSILANSEWVKK